MSGIFNVEESSHPSEFQTSAAEAQAHAPTSTIAREVEANANEVANAAQDAAAAAQTKGTALTGQSPLDRLHNDASVKTSQAVDQGKANVNAAKATGASYIEQAKTIATNAASTVTQTAQSYLPPPSGENGQHTTGDMVAGLQNAGSAALATTKEYLAAAQTTAQPHLEKARDVAATYMPGSATTQTAPVSGKDVAV
ncbi:hypothetical protein DFH07DRAFT_533084 [Mycena maculata]|uniref:Uncharacterized protein n=1 Tax=Mycena maculata TaxID=230809 RepID=A0AAD7IVE5_9AGAR|nr:hypothetical protein DFH07DRAFT_533084 [Mycena maculata]